MSEPVKLGPRIWKSHDSLAVVIDCPCCGRPAIVRDPQMGAITGKAWVDCPVGGRYSYLAPEVKELCRKVRS